jgi:hypothetical protein
MSDEFGPHDACRLFPDQERLALLDRILGDSAQTFARVGQEPKLQRMLGFMAVLALRDLCRVTVGDAREQRTQLLRQLSEEELAAAAQRAHRIAKGRHRAGHVLAGAAWASVRNATTALRIQRQLDGLGQHKAAFEYARNVVDAVLQRIDVSIAAYVEADASQLEEDGLFEPARMVDPAAPPARPPNSRRKSNLLPASGNFAARPNPVTLLLPYVIGAYAWQLHGWLIALGAAAAYLATLVAVNNVVIYRLMPEDTSLDRFVRTLQRVKWVTFVLFMIGLSLPGI